MFKKTLTEKLQRIFDIPKVSFDVPGESHEQECLFVEVESSKNWIKPPLQLARVKGKIRIFGNQDKIPYGYISKKINEADLDDIRDLFFHDFEENAGTFRNIAERSMSFVYLFESQYDPDQGVMNELNTTFTES